jgi:dihydrodipicolinate reductase
MEEVHHTQKLDAPSGTAISLANGIIENSNFTNWTLDNPTASDTNNGKQAKQIHIEAKELEPFLEHTVTYTSAVDAIEIKHTAHNRERLCPWSSNCRRMDCWQTRCIHNERCIKFKIKKSSLRLLIPKA